MDCHACGASVALGSSDRVGFRDTCTRCGADLHVCAHCAHHDPTAYNGCRESSAERVAEPTVANRCEYFRPAHAGDTGEPAASGRAADLDALEALFTKK